MDTNNKGKNIVNGSVGEKVTDYVFDKFPAGMRVLIVDDDSTCLTVLEKMLKDCQYEVTTCQRARDALSMLREDKKRFDILLIDLHMPEMDGLRLLDIVGVEMDLPVVIMSSNDRKEVVMRGIVHGACDYLVKPVRMDAIKILWQHVIRKKKKDLKEIGQLVSVEDSMVQLKQPDDAEIGQLVSVEDSVVQLKQPDDADNMSARNKENTKSSKRRNDDEDEGEAFEEASSERKRRLVWTQELHQKFVMAVDQLGRNAVPRKILGLMQEMNVPGITREKIASHLQKYRLFLQRQSESPQEAKGPFVEYSKISVFEKASLLEGCNHRPLGESGKSIVEQFSSLDGCNPQACATSSQPPVHCITIPPAGGLERQNANFHIGMPLVDQRNLSDNKIPESSSYPINRTKPSKLSFPFSRTSSGQSVFAKHICSGGLEMLNANSSLGLPVVDLTNHCDTKVTESSSYRVNELSRLASQLQRSNSGESVFAKIISSGGLEKLDEDSNLGSPLIDQTNHLDPKMLGSSSYPVNELAMVALPLWRINSGDSIFGNVASGGLGRQNAESSLGSPLVDLTNLTKWPESSSYPVTELSTFPASLPLSRTSSGEIAANKSVPTLGNTSSGEEYIHRNLGNIAQQSRNLSIDDSYVLRDDNMSDLLLHFKSFYQGDILRGPFT